MQKKSIETHLDGKPNPIDVHVGNRLRIYRTLRGITQEELASLLGLTFQQVQKYEKAQNRICASRLWELSKALQVPVSTFYEGLPGINTKRNTHQLPSITNESLKLKVAEEKELLNEDPLTRKETLELVRAYYSIADRNAARKIYELMRSMAFPSAEDENLTDKQ